MKVLLIFENFAHVNFNIDLFKAQKLVKDTLQQVWDFKAAQLAARRASTQTPNPRPKIDL